VHLDISASKPPTHNILFTIPTTDKFSLASRHSSLTHHVSATFSSYSRIYPIKTLGIIPQTTKLRLGMLCDLSPLDLIGRTDESSRLWTNIDWDRSQHGQASTAP
jgi:hypothetical protein